MGREPGARSRDLPGPSLPLTGPFDLASAPQAEVRFGDFLDHACNRLGLDYAAYVGTNPIDGSVHAYVNYPLSQW